MKAEMNTDFVDSPDLDDSTLVSRSTSTGRADFLACTLAIVASWAALNIPFLVGKSYIPWDSIYEFFPQVKFVANAIRSGQGPWWNPMMFGGVPVLGDPQGMIFSPHTVIAVLTGSLFNLTIFDCTTLLAELVGAIALARYVRTYAETKMFPILGAIVFIAGGVATSRLEHTPQIVSYALLPVQLLLIRAVCERPTVARGASLTLALVAGALNLNQVLFLSAFALFPFASVHVIESRKPAKAILALGIAGVAAMVAVLPLASAVAEFVKLSNRSAMVLAESSYASFPLFDIASLFLPGLYGINSGKFWTPTDLSQDFLYIGIVPFFILLVSAWRLDRSHWTARLCWGGLVASFVFAMGTHTPVYGFLFDHIPGFSSFRRPADGAYFINFFVALLIGSFCMPRRADISPKTVGRFAIAAGAVALVAVSLVLLYRYAELRGQLYDLFKVAGLCAIRIGVLLAIVFVAYRTSGERIRQYLPLVFVVFTIVDIGLAGRFGPVYAPALKDSPAAEVGANLRTKSYGGEQLQQTIDFLQSSTREPMRRFEALGGDLGSAMPIGLGLSTLQGYSPIRFAAFEKTIRGDNLSVRPKIFTDEAPSYDNEAYRRFGLRYVIIHHYIADNSEKFGKVGTAVNEVRNSLKAGSWAHEVQVPGMYEVWSIDDRLPYASARTDSGSEHACDLIKYQNTSVSVRCHASEPSRLILGDNYAPGWSACVNGNFAETEPYNKLFRSVRIPAGDVAVTFRYQAVPFLRRRTCS